MKYVKYAAAGTIGFLTGGPVGAATGLAGVYASDQQKKAMKQSVAGQQAVDQRQRQQISSAQADRKRLLQEQAGIAGGGFMRRRGRNLTSYYSRSGA